MTPRWQRLLAAVGVIVSFPFTALSALIIRLSSPGPVLFKSQRVGLDGSIFTMYKLRTMHHESSSFRSSITASGDPRIFPAGRWLRRLKLDELPQLLNVVRGEMCFFGPRPEDPDVVRNHYKEWMLETLRLPPGIVGPGSLSYFLEEASMPADPTDAERFYLETLLPMKLARDLVYVRNPSIAYQVELVARTAAGIVGLDCVFTSLRELEEERAHRILHEVKRGGAS